jgi:hypothetical protein
MATKAKAEKPGGTMSGEQARAERAFATGIQAALWLDVPTKGRLEAQRSKAFNHRTAVLVECRVDPILLCAKRKASVSG